MTPREIVLDQISHRETDIIPYSLGFEGDVTDRLDAHYGGDQWRDRLRTFIKGTSVVNTMKKDPTDREGYWVDAWTGDPSTWSLLPWPSPLSTATNGRSLKHSSLVTS